MRTKEDIKRHAEVIATHFGLADHNLIQAKSGSVYFILYNNGGSYRIRVSDHPSFRFEREAAMIGYKGIDITGFSMRKAIDRINQQVYGQHIPFYYSVGDSVHHSRLNQSGEIISIGEGNKYLEIQFESGKIAKYVPDIDIIETLATTI